MKPPLEISIKEMHELEDKGRAKIIPFGDEQDSIGIVGGTDFYIKRADHYAFLGVPYDKQDTHEVRRHD